MNSYHYSLEREQRERIIKNLIGEGVVIKEVVRDSGHRNGAEVHQITDTGIILIYNQRSGKLVTKLIARPNQLKRYFDRVPHYLRELAYFHKEMGWNEF